MEVKEVKEGLRREMRLLREALKTEEIDRKSRAVASRFTTLSFFNPLHTLGLYYPVRGEVEVWEILRQSVKKTVAFPRIRQDHLVFAVAESREDFRPGRWGIPEPTGRELSTTDLECIVFPGLAFDESGHRVGYGKGYYDRTLQGYSGRKVGLCYEFQMVSQIPAEQQDIRCDLVVTEQRIIGRLT